MSDNEIADLLRRGIDAARAGDKAAARSALEQVVKLDDQNEKAWFWLASVLEDDTRKRVALSTVLHLNPNNERAKRILDQMDETERERKAGNEIIPGVSRTAFILLAGVGALVVVGLLATFAFITISNNNRAAEATAVVLQLTLVENDARATALQARLNTEATQAATTPTVDPRSLAPTPPPTWTPTPEATATATAVALPFPPGLTGTIAAWAGRDVDNNGYLPVGTISTSTGAFTPAGGDEGRDVALNSQQQIAFTRFQPAIFDTFIALINTNGTAPEALPDRWQATDTLFSSEQPQYSASGDAIVFLALPDDGRTNRQVFLLSLLPQPPDVSPLRRLTDDESVYANPSFSPDGARIIAVRNNANAADAGEDLVTIDIATGGQLPFTTDRGAFVESHPRYSPDGTEIVYAAAPASEPRNADIALRFSNGQGTPTLIARSPGNDILPVFSPDGRYIAFSSNRGGAGYDIYVFDRETNTLYQLTNTPNEDEFIGGWR